MLKCFDPQQTWTFESPLAPGTVFTYRAMTGPIMGVGFRVLAKTGVNTFVTKVTNIAIHVSEKQGDKTVRVLKEFPEFVPEQYPDIRLADCIPFQVATALFSDMWSHTALTPDEAGE